MQIAGYGQLSLLMAVVHGKPGCSLTPIGSSSNHHAVLGYSSSMPHSSAGRSNNLH